VFYLIFFLSFSYTFSPVLFPPVSYFSSMEQLMYFGVGRGGGVFSSI
jgi:hypothetical protein